MKKKISKKLTDRSIAVLKPGKQPYLVYDTEVGKLAVRVMPSGKTTYVIYARMPGAKNASVKKIAGDASTQIWKPQDARERAQVLLNKIAIGLDPFDDGRTGVTFEEAYLRFLKDSLQKKGVTKLGVEDRRFWPDLERQQFNTFRRFAAAHKSILLSDATEKKVFATRRDKSLAVVTWMRPLRSGLASSSWSPGLPCLPQTSPMTLLALVS